MYKEMNSRGNTLQNVGKMNDKSNSLVEKLFASMKRYFYRSKDDVTMTMVSMYMQERLEL